MSDYASTGDSVSLAKIDFKPFTITEVVRSDYTQGEEVTRGIKITTKEMFDVGKNDEGKDLGEFNKFHTTRIALVNFLLKDNVMKDINGGKPLGLVKCKEGKSKSRGTVLFTLVDCDKDGQEKLS